MANMGPMGILKHIDDPSVDIVAAAAATTISWVSDCTSTGTDFKRAVAAGKGLHYAGANTAVDNELIEFCSNNKIFSPQEGHCAIEMLYQADNVTVPSFNFGFNDTVEDGNLPIDASGTTMAATATDWIGFVYDGTDATNKDLHCAWVVDDTMKQTDMDGKVDGQVIRMSGMAPTAGKWFYMKVELDDEGSGNSPIATFLAVDHLGRSVEKRFDTNLTRSDTFCYHFATETRAATIVNHYLRGCNWEQTIPNM